MDRLEDRVKEYVIRYMDPDKFGGKIFVIHDKDIMEFTDLSKARSAAFSMPGISIVIAVPKKDEVDEAFMKFMKLIKGS
ncbi:hypothetical protein [Vulcanisaeta distributa]|uniref:DUF5678 domain-containing protein n=1 Tax=Vulcanisaeta distributa (strain DSM 14429 / JCM 11212 / NBRC 100878 / IC-017) TaxID=572478 RepID=E1QQJ1_VULDI|nr:hypothetical protein [Vulcanisaeta distributa]ADN50486.1 hypothetical protein Vdis_1098 [Vulcanisaeta distributa DSM 14429]